VLTNPNPDPSGHEERLGAFVMQALEREIVNVSRDLRIARRLVWLVASPPVLGAGLLIFVVLAWAIFDRVGPSGTTSTALVVAALLILVPAALATLRGKTTVEHAQDVFQLAEAVVNPPPKPDEPANAANVPITHRP
jgi:hypothetical protein